MLTKSMLVKKYPVFFAKDAMEYFGCRVEACGWVAEDGSDVFITSECDESGIVWMGERRFTVRTAYISDGGQQVHHTIGFFGEFGTLKDALMSARRLLGPLGGEKKSGSEQG